VYSVDKSAMSRASFRVRVVSLADFARSSEIDRANAEVLKPASELSLRLGIGSW
jgi:hypothetical protein